MNSRSASSSRLAPCLAFLLLLVAPGAHGAENEFAKHVRTTPPLLPEEERETFHLPPGFEIQLFASEPAIQKPMNLAFDARGRLWVSGSTEYPYPAPGGRRARDSVRILEDLDGDGRAEKMTVFADGLNVPIGLYPFEGGAIVFSIPNIWLLEDTDGDDRADRRRVLYGPFGFERDTHGLNNGFRRGFDGWLYANHGFNNHTVVRGGDGHEVRMQSGNSYRIRIDGSRIEQFTHGQVNPFGRTLDPLGNHFSADCHSKPIYQLLRGAYYPSFGRPHDGLGFAPRMMDHLHGSTAIAGIAYYAARQFPEEYHGNIFVGNVVTSRVNRDSVVYHGATMKAHEEPDFVITDDPWFRPVDLRVGPDGALYIADFYNRIIGHYEVPLDHPGRDRHRGRIWRVVYRGEAGALPPTTVPDLTAATVPGLIEALASRTLARRLVAADQLVDRIGTEAIGPVRAAFDTAANAPRVRVHCLWVLFRLGALDGEILAAAARDASRELRVHALRALAETPYWTATQRGLALEGLEDPDAFVRLAAADALGRHPNFDHVAPLLSALDRVEPADEILTYKLRQSLRDQLRPAGHLTRFGETRPDEEAARWVAGVALSIPTPEAGAHLVHYLQRYPVDVGTATAYLRHAARLVVGEGAGSLVSIARERLSGEVDTQLALLEAIRVGVEQRGAEIPESLRAWGSELTGELLESIDLDSLAWTALPFPGQPGDANPWVLERRRSADGTADGRFFSSLPRGEQLTGVLRSRVFKIPERLTFFVAGHVGPPDRPVVARNFVRLRSAVDGSILAEAMPPRDDTARPVEWSLADHAGARGFLEIVDGDSRGAFAWLAVGRFQPGVVAIPELDPATVASRAGAAARLAGQLRVESAQPALARALRHPRVDPAARRAAARALLSLRPDPVLAALAETFAEPEVPEALRAGMADAIVERDAATTLEVLREAMRSLPARLQLTLATGLAGHAVGARALLDLVEAGQASPRLLQRRSVRERLLAVGPETVADRIEELTARLGSQDEALEALIRARCAAYPRVSKKLDRGAELFKENCSVCHQLDGEGGLVGPQLDGIGSRGVERLVEDVLDPNRNVDVAFRSTTYILGNGTIVTGLYRRTEGETVVVVNSNGEEVTFPRGLVLRSAPSAISPMPENFAEALPESDFYDILAFLLSRREPPSPVAGE